MTLAKQKESFEGLKLLRDKDRFCIVFEQGGPTAQGADFFALLVDCQKKEAELQAFQCKHTKMSKERTLTEWKEWWATLGVDLSAAPGSSELTPTAGLAGYSYKGLDGLKNHLFQALRDKHGIKELKLGKRTMACSFSPSWPEADRLLADTTRAWFREHFEPTISVFPPPNVEEQHPRRRRPASARDPPFFDFLYFGIDLI